MATSATQRRTRKKAADDASHEWKPTKEDFEQIDKEYGPILRKLTHLP